MLLALLCAELSQNQNVDFFDPNVPKMEASLSLM